MGKRKSKTRQCSNVEKNLLQWNTNKLKSASRNLERLVARVLPCKRTSPNCITKLFAQSEIASEKTPSHESTKQRVESSFFLKKNNFVFCAKDTSMTRYNLVHKFILIPQVMKIPDSNVAVDKMERARETQHGNWKDQQQEGGYSRNTKSPKESPLYCTDRHTLSQKEKTELEPKLQQHTGRAVLRGDIVKDESGPTHF